MSGVQVVNLTGNALTGNFTSIDDFEEVCTPDFAGGCAGGGRDRLRTCKGGGADPDPAMAPRGGNVEPGREGVAACLLPFASCRSASPAPCLGCRPPARPPLPPPGDDYADPDCTSANLHVLDVSSNALAGPISTGAALGDDITDAVCSTGCLTLVLVRGVARPEVLCMAPLLVHAAVRGRRSGLGGGVGWGAGPAGRQFGLGGRQDWAGGAGEAQEPRSVPHA